MQTRSKAIIAALCLIAAWSVVAWFGSHNDEQASLETNPFVNGESGFPQPDLPPAKGFVATLGDGGSEPLVVKSTGPITVSCRVTLDGRSQTTAITASIVRNTGTDWVGTGANGAGTASATGTVEITLNQPRRNENTSKDSEYALVVFDYAGYEIGRRPLKFE